MAISMRTGNSTKTRSINAIIRPNFQRCPRRGHTCNSFLEDNADGMTLQDRRLEAQGLRRCSKRATPGAKSVRQECLKVLDHHWQLLGVMAIALIDLIIQGHLRVGLTKQRIAHWA